MKLIFSMGCEIMADKCDKCGKELHHHNGRGLCPKCWIEKAIRERDDHE